MAARQLKRRAPCHCGSGRRYKNCHGKKERIAPLVVDGEGGFSAMLHLDSLKVDHVEEVDSMIPEWLLLHAANFAEDATAGGGHAATMMTVLLTAAASEAIVNRLLGPLVPAQEWAKKELKTSPIEKWKELGAMIGLKNEISPGRAPLQHLAAVQDLRNEFSHFKHGRHASTVTRSLRTTFENGRIIVDVDNPGPPSENRGAGPKLEDAMSTSRARSYFDALLATLELALGSYVEDRFQIVERLRTVIAQARASRASATKA